MTHDARGDPERGESFHHRRNHAGARPEGGEGVGVKTRDGRDQRRLSR
jgi:hypothetical protein